MGYRQSLYIYGIPYACIRSRYGYIVNNKNTLKHPDVVILDKDNNLIIFFCVQYDYILQDVMVRHAIFNNSSMFQANKLSSRSAQIQTSHNATTKEVRYTPKTNKLKKIKSDTCILDWATFDAFSFGHYLENTSLVSHCVLNQTLWC